MTSISHFFNPSKIKRMPKIFPRKKKNLPFLRHAVDYRAKKYFSKNKDGKKRFKIEK